MIARIWRGTAATARAETYQTHFCAQVAPHLKKIAGHRGASLLRREVDGVTEFLAITLWESMESVRAFAGERPEVAIVEPEARAVLTDFDKVVHHYEVVHADASA